MSKDKLGVLTLSVLALGWVSGVVAGHYANSLVLAASVAFGLPTAIAAIFATPFSRAWWSTNRDEAAQANFASEAKSSLRLVAFMMLPLAAITGARAFAIDSVNWAAVAGSFLALSAAAALRLRDVSARNSL